MRSSGHLSHRHGHKPFHHRSSNRSTTDTQGNAQSPETTSIRSDGATLFIEDRKGDRRNLEYASADRYAIPRYYAAGNGGLIGLDRKYRITSRSESRREVENVELDSTRRPRRQSLLTRPVGEDEPNVKLSSHSNNSDDLHDDFITFEDSRPRKKRRTSGQSLPYSSSQESSDESDVDTDQISTHDESTDAFDAFKNDPTHRRYLELSRATAESPTKPEVWLAFIDYQETSFNGRQRARDIGTASSRSLAELRISLYEKALSHVRDLKGRHTLILGLMREGSQVWDVQKQTAQWETFLDKDASFDLWALYLNFVQGNALRFKMETCLEVYKRCLQKFERGTDEHVRDSQCIYLILRMTVFLWDAGYTEQAVGMWQAMLEYNLFRPNPITANDLIPALEQFWTGEVPRIGEEGAAGWSSNTNVEVKENADKQHPTLQALDFASWAAAEFDLDRNAGLPARTLDDVSDDDPYRVLLFSDLSDFLFSINAEKGIRLLQDAFLLFVGLPPLTTSSESRSWKHDPFVYGRTPSSSRFAPLLSSEKEMPSPSVVLPEIYFTIRAVISPPNSALPAAGRVAGVYLDFVRRAVLQLTSSPIYGRSDELMMEYGVAIEAAIDLKSARKMARAFLKRKPDSMRLYNIYALLECQLDNFGAAEKVWSTALSMQKALKPDATRQAFVLWRDWAYSCMFLKKFHQARVLLSMIADANFDPAEILVAQEEAPSPATQIKVEQHIKSAFEACRLSAQSDLLPILVDLLAIAKYLNNGLCIDSAMGAYDAAVETIASSPTVGRGVIETIHECRARLLHAHSTMFGQPFKPRELWQILSESIRSCPDNVDLLLLQHFYSQKAGLVDRLRQVESSAVENHSPAERSKNVIPCVFDVVVELNRPYYSGSTNHSIRAAFRRATEKVSAGHDCVGLWKAYVLWELSLLNNGSYPKAKSIATEEGRRPRRNELIDTVYASLRACPWSKELYMLVFADEALRDTIGTEGLKRLAESMLERGLRLHIDFSDWFL
ncbi:NRDE-2, necessary for RNA interference-domain-containing protein [Exophiala viscosa]|uniref:NRDE-2, necessary for RNA interference-domain-containing protein n=1 Tax=Exophiala viscosa TaxID=2486360 RepID=A0AAN6DMD4_9EURO|nr:NRDE-2, necessary for RNA interference-domain-containing protein [Exophiala viscosa]